MKKYVCTVCGYVYDEAAGDPDTASKFASVAYTKYKLSP